MALVLRNSFLPDMFEGFLNTGWENNYKNTNYQPAVNVSENDDRFDIEMALPGLKKEDVKIDVEQDELTIKYEGNENEASGMNYLRREFRTNNFEKVFTLPESVNTDEIKATMNDGVLRIELYKKEEAKVKPAREIKIG
ncbi:MAG: Hsp20/alpha crystallin family protein [Bacteroidota bacterium]